MAGVPRAPSRLGQSTRNAPTRPAVNRVPSNRAPSSRTAHTLSTDVRAGQRHGPTSPTGSSASVATSNSQTAAGAHGRKRKERDFDEEDASHETNINVVVRCRGRNDREVRENSGVVLGTDGIKGNTVELSLGPTALSNKMYHFDKVFSPAADQGMVYDEVVKPMLGEMLSGYNCTIFAYGQTGTGKTYTMSGDMSDGLGTFSDTAGIIPRALRALFTKLDADGTESSVKCSFIELYNEELRDLISAEETTKLKIYDDASKKSHTATIVQGMEECHIKTAAEGIKLLQLGSQKRQVAATKCNDLSSRSHTIFTVTVYAKRTSEAGEDVVALGKLNLVDLAGSENIGRSGAENKRAIEAGLINKSLLTLGRVINALVDKGSHIPYRESKLTRLLQDSLGGRTKTCIIATVSPANANLEETMSTLDYAFRAKNIRNKPQMNATISKLTLLKEFTAEIEKMKSELIVTRQRNGVHLTNESYEGLIGENESRRLLTEEQKNKIEVMELSLRNKVQELFSLATNLNVLQKEHESAKGMLDDTQGLLAKTELVLKETNESLQEETTLRRAHQKTEENLQDLGTELIANLGQASSDLDGLWSKNRRKSDLQTQNQENWDFCQAQVSDVTRLVEIKADVLLKNQQQSVKQLQLNLQELQDGEVTQLGEDEQQLDTGFAGLENMIKTLGTSSRAGQEELSTVLQELQKLKATVKGHFESGLRTTAAFTNGAIAEARQQWAASNGKERESFELERKLMGSSIWELHDEWSVDKKIRAEQEEYLKKLLRKQTTAHDRMVENLQRQLVEESEQTAAERSELLEQVKELMDRDEQGQKARDERWLARLQVQQEFAQGLLAVLKKDPVDWVERSRDVSRDWERNVGTLKGIEKSMQTFASDRLQSFGALNRSLQGVQNQTLATIDQQVTQFTSQMQSMDEFVQKVQTETHRQETDRQQRLQAAQDQIAINQHLNRTLHSSARIRLAARVEVAKAHTAKLNEALAASEQEIVQPLAQLRTDVSAVPFVPYVATGATPARRAVRIPHQLPRTNRSPLQISSLEPEAEESTSAKSLVYADEDPENQARKSSTIREEQVEDVVIDEGTYAGLREVDPNAHAPKQTIVPPRDFSMSLPLKRLLSSNEITGAGKPVKKKRATRATMAALACEGSENGGSVQAGFARSTGRRLRGREVL